MGSGASTENKSASESARKTANAEVNVNHTYVGSQNAQEESQAVNKDITREDIQSAVKDAIESLNIQPPTATPTRRNQPNATDEDWQNVTEIENQQASQDQQHDSMSRCAPPPYSPIHHSSHPPSQQGNPSFPQPAYSITTSDSKVNPDNEATPGSGVFLETALESKSGNTSGTDDDKPSFANFTEDEESAFRPVWESKFEEAISLLEKLPERQTQQLMLAECYFQFGNNNKAMRYVGKLENMMMSSSPQPRRDDVEDAAVDYYRSSSYIRALILLMCASKLGKADPDPNDAARWARDCSAVIDDMVRQRGRMREIAESFGIDVLLEILSDLRSITGAVASVKAEMEAWCLFLIASSYNEFDEKLKALEFCQQGIDLMKQNFGSNAVKYRIFSFLLHDAGVAHYHADNDEEAETFYVESIESSYKATDWESYNEREELLDKARYNLENLGDDELED